MYLLQGHTLQYYRKNNQKMQREREREREGRGRRERCTLMQMQNISSYVTANRAFFMQKILLMEAALILAKKETRELH